VKQALLPASAIVVLVLMLTQRLQLLLLLLNGGCVLCPASCPEHAVASCVQGVDRHCSSPAVAPELQLVGWHRCVVWGDLPADRGVYSHPAYRCAWYVEQVS
jgi:hypothetical protein